MNGNIGKNLAFTDHDHVSLNLVKTNGLGRCQLKSSGPSLRNPIHLKGINPKL